MPTCSSNWTFPLALRGDRRVAKSIDGHRHVAFSAAELHPVRAGASAEDRLDEGWVVGGASGRAPVAHRVDLLTFGGDEHDRLLASEVLVIAASAGHLDEDTRSRVRESSTTPCAESSAKAGFSPVASASETGLPALMLPGLTSVFRF